MGFKYHEDSFLKKYESKVVSCNEAEFTPKDSEGKLNGYNVILEDTILFPEGGGQPCDYGHLNNKPVLDVIREGENVIHFVHCSEPFQIGETVEQELDWNRRLDHMQQHSGQHLISALFENDFGYKTTKWNLGAEVSFIELDAKKMTAQEVEHVERKANELILKQLKVFVSIIDNENEVEIARASRGLPKDQVGPLRVINIEGIDSNMCCGTHVTNLAQLQMIKILEFELTKGRYLVHFLIGNRVLKKLEESYKRELEFNILLNCGAPTHIEMLKKIKDNLKSNQRALQKALKDLAVEEAKRFNILETIPKYYFLHRKDGLESDFLSVFLRNVKVDITETLFFFTSTADDLNKGHLILKGQQKHIEILSSTLSEILDCKGNQTGDRYQGKFNKLKGIKECEKKIKEYFKNIEI